MSGGKRKTRKNNMDMEGGKRKRKNENMEGGKRKRKNENMEGGKRKTRKASPWNKFVKKIFDEMRRKDKGASFGDALKAASRRKSEM